MDPSALSASYGTVADTLEKTTHAKMIKVIHHHSKRPSLFVLGALAFFPWLLFCCTFSVRCFELRYAADRNAIRYENLNVAESIVYLFLLPILWAAWVLFKSARKNDGDPSGPKVVLTITFAVAWAVGFILGDYNYTNNLRPYYEIRDLEVYPAVDPANYTGSQLMDAGMIQFIGNSSLWLERAIGFKNEDVHCVVPIRSGLNQNQNTFDFWAVGLNCCSAHRADFKCGEFSNPMAKWGLRLMDDEKRKMFRLAVQEAEAAYGLSAPHPVMLYWLSDPMTELQAYEEAGWSCFVFWVFVYFSVQLFLVLVLENVLSHI